MRSMKKVLVHRRRALHGWPPPPSHGPFGTRAQDAHHAASIVAFPPGRSSGLRRANDRRALGKETGAAGHRREQGGRQWRHRGRVRRRAAPDARRCGSPAWAPSPSTRRCTKSCMYDVRARPDAGVTGREQRRGAGGRRECAVQHRRRIRGGREKQPGSRLTLASSGTGQRAAPGDGTALDPAKLNVLHVPYKGAAPAITDVIAGHVDGLLRRHPRPLGHIKSGKVKAIGIAAHRSGIRCCREVRTF
jgi:hypothetical protein